MLEATGDYTVTYDACLTGGASLVSLWHEVQSTVFFVTHSIEEAVFLGDRVYVMGRAPGKILRELEVEPAREPARVIQRDPRFQETVTYIRDLISQLEEAGLQNNGDEA